MSQWDGWSENRHQVDLTRILVSMLDSVAGGQTVQSVAGAIQDLGIDMAEDEAWTDLSAAGVFDEEQGIVPTADPQILSTRGREVVAQKRKEAAAFRRHEATANAIIMWLGEVGESPNTARFLEAPHSWYWGSRFTEDAILRVGVELKQTGATTGGVMGDPLVRARLTPVGRQRLTALMDGEPHAAAVTNQTNIGTMTNYGTANVSSTIGTQSTVNITLTADQATTTLAAILSAALQSGEVPGELVEEATSLAAELSTAPDSGDALGTLARARLFLGKVAAHPLPNSLLNVGLLIASAKIGLT